MRIDENNSRRRVDFLTQRKHIFRTAYPKKEIGKLSIKTKWIDEEIGKLYQEPVEKRYHGSAAGIEELTEGVLSKQ